MCACIDQQINGWVLTTQLTLTHMAPTDQAAVSPPRLPDVFGQCTRLARIQCLHLIQYLHITYLLLALSACNSLITSWYEPSSSAICLAQSYWQAVEDLLHHQSSVGVAGNVHQAGQAQQITMLYFSVLGMIVQLGNFSQNQIKPLHYLVVDGRAESEDKT